MKLLTTLFSFRGTISRAEYVIIALVGIAIKHVVDLGVASIFGRPWSFPNYLVPLGVPVPIRDVSLRDLQFLAAMLAISFPFAWVGLAITAKRFRTIGWPSWLVVAFFVPIANVASFALAAAWPEGEQSSSGPSASWLRRIVPADRLGAAVFALLTTAALGTVLVSLSTTVIGSYGWGLFAALPFAQGAIAASIDRVHGDRPIGSSLAVALLSVGVTGLALLGLALEGAVCIFMAMPLALAFAMIGAVFAHSIGGRLARRPLATILACALLAPTIMGVERLAPPFAPGYAVTTSVEIAAPPRIVWRNVVSFVDLPPPTELPFRVGVAYPMRAKIIGRGVGAVRFCQFSTGDFVEPITVWQREHRLGFAVIANPEPMREWSPYGALDTPHLHGYMQSRQGEFVLDALPNGHTRLTGRTWYQHHLWPATYWALWSDSIVHQIHGRVLRHIKRASES